MSQVYGWMHVTRWCFLQSKINTVLQPSSNEMNIWPLTHSSVNDSGLENPPLILDSLQLQVHAVQKGLCVRAGIMPHLFLGAVLFSFICFTWAFIFISAFVLMCAQCMLRYFSPTGHMYGPVTLWIRLAWSPWPTGPWMITLFCEGHDFYQ